MVFLIGIKSDPLKGIDIGKIGDLTKLDWNRSILLRIFISLKELAVIGKVHELCGIKIY